MQPGCILVPDFSFSSIRCIKQKELLELPASVFFSVNHARMLGVPGSLTRLEKSTDKRHGRTSHVKLYTNQGCAWDPWSVLMAKAVRITSSYWTGGWAPSSGEQHFPSLLALSPGGSWATQQVPLPQPTRAGGLPSASLGVSACAVSAPSSWPSSLGLLFDSADTHLAVVLLGLYCPKFAVWERKCVFLPQALVNVNLCLCLKWNQQTWKLNVSREQKLNNCEIHGYSAENVSSCQSPF